ncbi:AMP-binding protein [Microvirga subterranea]|uniref:Acyl-CoA synthetase (AMP-forming)/AMP-acid ligase II n=1 Tax=Microvirga subterranea TaxID=186651 RepID=A0A370HJT0_9HYPH|nr:AMP-binding protein [Microvirga subterranea]RDI57946.1 acyl-CoA synthetase (AMP-forming)/AMP-acid ligase II [Microvirga subterranea]
MLRQSKTFENRGAGIAGNLRDDKDQPDAPLTLGAAIRRNAYLFSREPAIVCSTSAPLTYGDLGRQIDTVRRHLRDAGFDREARIGVMMPNGPEAVLGIVALSCCAVAVPLDPRLTEAEIDQRLGRLHLSALVLPHDRFEVIRPIAEQHGVALIEAAPAGWHRLGLALDIPAIGAPALDEEPDPYAPAFILQTSGTTAQPKLIPFSHANMLAAAMRMQAWFGLTPRDRCLSVSPPFYSHGLKVTVFTPLVTGGSIALPANAGHLDLPEWFDALRPTWLSAGPTLHRALLDATQGIADVQSLHTLRLLISGGAKLPDDVREDLQAVLGVPVFEHYGSSEAAQIAANCPPPGASRPGTCGRPCPGTLAIMGEDEEPVAPGLKGEIWVRGPTVIQGYLDAPDLNRAAFVRGWFRTGDIGSLDDDGFLSLHGRLSEQINRGGEKIAPGEIDIALLRHPDIAEAAAFAVPHPRLGEDVAAAVVLHPGARTTPAELRRFLQQDLASFKIPHRILVLDALPKGTTGKVQRRRLTEMIGPQGRANAAPPGRPASSHLEADLLRLWRRLLKSEALTVDDDFFESGGDSLLATEMLIEAERLVGHPLPETIMFEAETIRRFMPRIAAQAAAPPAPVFQFHTDGDRPPLFFFHGDFASGGFYVRRMVHLLGPDHPIITIDPHGLHGEPIPSSIEAMAADRLPHILERQASGPFLLGGQCNGALVAFEAARLLMAAGHRVEMVAMVDPPTVSARPMMRTILRLAQHHVSPQRLARIYDQLGRLERVLKMSPGEFLAKAHDVVVNTDDRLPPSFRRQAFTVAMARYLPAPLDVPVVFYSASHDGRAWRRLSGNLEVIEVPGGHDYCLTTGAELLVQHLRHRIDALSEVPARLR